jgi:hypothetical protein
MREKDEREAPHRSSGAIRLTEFDLVRRDGFVNRLTKDTTSFFFSNFPEETEVMELWTLFAKYGRVGEVYVPKKETSVETGLVLLGLRRSRTLKL